MNVQRLERYILQRYGRFMNHLSTWQQRHNNRVPVALWKPEPAQNVACLTGLRSNPIPEGLYRLPTYKIRPESGNFLSILGSDNCFRYKLRRNTCGTSRSSHKSLFDADNLDG